MKKQKKLALYELNPRFFKDSTGNGIGDLKGLANKMDYFDFLGVDAILLSDLIATGREGQEPDFKNVSSEIGTINDFNLVIEKAKKFKKAIFIELKLGSLSKEHRWVKNALEKSTEYDSVVEMSDSKPQDDGFKYSKDKKVYYRFNEETQEVPLNWLSEQVVDRFVDVIRFWREKGVYGFVLKGFEYLVDVKREEPMNEKTLKELRKFYRTIKEIDENITVIGETDFLNLELAEQFTTGNQQVFDYFKTTDVSMLGVDKELLTDGVGKFRAKDLAKILKKHANSNANILSFGSSRVGRIISRWGNDGQFINESAKSLAMALMLNKSSSSIYYGDEIGTPNIGLTHLDDFQDKTLDVRKSFALKNKISERDFMDAQVMQAPINARSIFAWNAGKNGGFSNSEKTITPSSIWHKEMNVETEFKDPASILNFVKELVRVTTTSTYAKIIQNGSFKVSSKIAGVIKIISKLDDKILVSYINLTDAEKPIIFGPKVGKVILSTIHHKEYKEIPTKLEPFESLLIYIKPETVKAEKTQEVKITKKAEFIKDEIEVEEIDNVKEDSEKAIEMTKDLNHSLEEVQKDVDDQEIEEVVDHNETHEIIVETHMSDNATTHSLEEDIENISNDDFAVVEDDTLEMLNEVDETKLHEEVEIERESNNNNELELEVVNMQENMTHEEEKSNDDEIDFLEIEKAKAKTSRDFELSRDDDRTQLREEELAKTVQIDDTVDLDILFEEEINKK